MWGLGVDNSRTLQPKSTAFRIMLVGWSAIVLCGMGVLIRYSNTAGAVGTPPRQLPAKSVPAAVGDRHTLVMFIHPRCPCSRASLRELARIISQCGDQLVGQVFFYRPKNKSNAWVQTGLWSDAAKIPGLRTGVDVAGAEAVRFSATTSGHVLLYDPGGRLVFQGGVTAGRGHEGDNLGKDTIVALVNGHQVTQDHSPVFGCPILGPHELNEVE